MYEPVHQYRYWDKDRLYSQIDWTDFNSVVDAFELRIDGWYLNPAQELAKDGHQAFSVLALDCLIIDMLSQFYFGVNKSSKNIFIKYADEILGFSKPLIPPIDYIKQNGKPGTLNTEAEAFYSGFRCGILHEGHIALYGGINPGQVSIFAFIYSSKLVKYTNGNDCPSLIINPLKLLEHLDQEFRCYLKLLKSGTDLIRIQNFKAKFFNSFGIAL